MLDSDLITYFTPSAIPVNAIQSWQKCEQECMFECLDRMNGLECTRLAFDTSLAAYRPINHVDMRQIN